MMRSLFLIIFVVTFFYCCSDKTSNAKSSPSFKSFEISFVGGKTTFFSFIVDTNKIYFLSNRADAISYYDTTNYYGILPDTIFNLIDTTFSKIRSDPYVKSKDEGCNDCPVLALKIVSNPDTIRINQTGDIDDIFNPLIKAIQKFIDSTKHQSVQAALSLETKSIIPLLPPKIDLTKLKSTVATKESGR